MYTLFQILPEVVRLSDYRIPGISCISCTKTGIGARSQKNGYYIEIPTYPKSDDAQHICMNNIYRDLT